MGKPPTKPRPPKSTSSAAAAIMWELREEFRLYRQKSEDQALAQREQITELKIQMGDDRKAVKSQFDSVNSHLTALMTADGRMRTDLEQFIGKYDAPKMLVRIEGVEKEIDALKSRNDKQDGAATMLRIMWLVIGGVIGGVTVGLILAATK